MGNSNIYICLTYYHVLVSLVKEISKKRYDSDIVICSTIPQHQKLMEKLKESGIFSDVFFFDEEKYRNENTLWKKNLGRFNLLIFNYNVKKNIKLNFKLDKHTYEEVNIFNDAAYIGYYLRANRIYYNLLEDAKDSYKVLHNYMTIDYRKKLRHRFFCFETYFCHGKSKYSKIVEVNNSEGLQIPPKKLVVNKKEDMFRKLSLDDKKRIYDIFIKDDDFVLSENTEGVLILTQPLNQDNMVDSNETQKMVYEDILSEYCSDGNIFIKPHPRDDFDYSNHFSDVTVIDKNIPIEILDFNPKVKFKKAITISSSSIYGIDFVEEKIYLGFEWLKKYN